MSSFFNKALASIGIGAAKVDTKLFQDKFIPGEMVKGIIEIKGGATEQRIDEIYLTIATTYIKESNDNKVKKQGTIDKVKVVDSFTIGPSELKEFPFSITLPINTPISLGQSKVWIQTGLDIKNAIDPSDKDFIHVSPTPIVSAIINEAYDLGFSLRKVECEEAPYRFRTQFPFIQEFELIPTTGPFRGKLDEIEFIFLTQTEDQVDVHMQIDRRARGLGSLFAEALDMDESFVNFTVTKNDIPQLKKKLGDIISRYC
ncbi:sporulation protein [Litchfieldia salsa]|uniref:Sporulation-control protein n=1 Tax=Litchfieldia salsa TaxID=930152 RepID=A0A1H0T7S9_9BACI|nr:sporulation protein [Litchfieldia salsa]SDP50097.1 sporulation-control protein [Litchfieldia salsa]